MKKTLGIVFVLLFLLCSCGQTEDKPVSVSVANNAFSATFGIDEPLDCEGVYITVTFQSGKTVSVLCTEDAVSGFDSSTTGNKSMTVCYNGIVSDPIEYTVYNKENALYEVRTHTRLAATSEKTEEGIVYLFSLKNMDLSGIRALSFVWTGGTATNFSDNLAEISAIPKAPMTRCEFKRLSAKKIRVLVYAEQYSLDYGGDVLSLSVFGGTDTDFSVGEIIVSDGKSDYRLPKLN